MTINPFYLHGVEQTPLRKLLFMGALAGGKEVEDTATGNPLTFVTDLARPLESCLATWQPHQSGSGDPSPENVRPITGMDGVTVWHTGKNIYPVENLNRGYIDNSGNFQPQNNNALSDYIPYVYGTKITVYIRDNVGGKVQSTGIAYYDENKNFLGINSQYTRAIPYTFNAYSRTGNGYIRIWLNRDNENYTVDEFKTFGLYAQFGDDFSKYEPYHGTSYPVAFPVLGKNLLNVADRESGYIASNGKIAPDNTNIAFGYILLKANESYAISTKGTVTNIGVCLYEMDKTTVISRYNNNKSSVIIDSANADRYMRVWMNYDGSSDLSTKTDAEIIQLFAPQVEKGSSATPYEPYTRTVYGGTLDLTTGVLTATWKGVVLNGTESYTKPTTPYTNGARYNSNSFDDAKIYNNNAMSDKMATLTSAITEVTRICFRIASGASRTAIYMPDSVLQEQTVEALTAWLAENKPVLCYELAEPITVATLSPTQITALIGNNTMWADADELSVTYLKKG